MSGDVDEDAITTESLQAQIDMSMSFAQSLVTSWVKPSSKASSSRSRVLESELLETARRRPRLGVGAAETSEARTSSRDSARLKGQLVGKKRGREQAEADNSKSKADYEDAEESRAGAIKKKAKADPFAPSHKKMKAPIHHLSSAQSGAPVSQTGHSKPTAVVSDETKPNVQLHPPSPKKKKNKANHANAIAVEEQSSSSRDAVTLPPPTISAVQDKTVICSPVSLEIPIDLNAKDNDKLDILSTTSSSGANNDLPPSNSANTSKLPLALLVKVRDVTSPTKLPAELRDQPILNLEAISSDSESEGELPKSPQTISKRKRKRRKKKKKNLVDNSPVSPETVQSPQIKLLIT